MSQFPSSNNAAPIGAVDRIDAIDIVRGIALYGVMAMNVVTVFRVSIFQQFLPQAPEANAIDQFVSAALQFAADMKAFSLFSLLFGVGLAIQYERLSRGGAPYRWLVRRLFVLLAFGLFHFLVVWDGDILTEYALAGLVVLPFLARSNWSIGVASTYVLLFYCVMPLLHLPIPRPSQAAYHELVTAANDAYRHGSFGAVLEFNFHEAQEFIPLHLWVFPRTIGLFLLGMLTWRLGILQRPTEHKPAIAAIALVALVAGTLLTACDVMSLIQPHSALAALRGPISKIAAPTLAVGYGVGLFWLSMFTPARHLLGAFAPLGKMAFTNYLAQSVIFCLLFYGYGLGLAGRTGPAFALLIGTTVYVLQMVVSAWWLQGHRFGPLEWLWRTLMYGKRQPMLVAVPAALRPHSVE